MRREAEFKWDAFDVYIFDIDGTLLHCADAVHYFAFCNALSTIAGKPVNLDGVTAHGNTDTGIVRDAFALAGVAESVWRPRVAEIHTLMCSYVAAHRDEFCIRALPMVRDTLERLRSRGAVLGVATGNLKLIGEEKLSAAGLLSLFDFTTWSDGLEERSAVFARAVEMARQMAGKAARMIVIGDTPADIRAAHRNGLAAVGVATGIYNCDELNAEDPELCIHSLEELAIPA